jgi:hypothetical protein
MRMRRLKSSKHIQPKMTSGRLINKLNGGNLSIQESRLVDDR